MINKISLVRDRTNIECLQNLLSYLLPGGHSNDETSSSNPTQYNPPLKGDGFEQLRVRFLAQVVGLTS